VRAEFHRPDAPDDVVAAATWTGSHVRIDVRDPVAAEAVEMIFRRTPVVIDDLALRSFGTSGPAVLEPGDLRWFIAAARTRAEADGLAVRLVPPEGAAMGWDPAGAYRTFADAAERRDRLAGAPG